MRQLFYSRTKIDMIQSQVYRKFSERLEISLHPKKLTYQY